MKPRSRSQSMPATGLRPGATHWGPALVVLLVGVAVLVGGPHVVRSLVYAKEQSTVQQASERLATSNPLVLINEATQDLAAKVEPSVVHVSTSGYFRNRQPGTSGFYTSSGSGFVYDTEGHIVTNAHVVAAADVLEVQFSNGEKRSARFVGSDVRSDIAVVKVSPERLHPAERSTDLPRQGDLVFAFGSPFDFRFSMSSGIVSGLSRSAGLAGLDHESFIQVDAAVNPGNSGGPLCDVEGRVIGMNTAIATGRGNMIGEEGQFAGIGLAIPMAMIELVVDQLINDGEVAKGYLGIEMRSLDALSPNLQSSPIESAASQYFDGQGVLIIGVPEGHPAALAGVQPGDILLSVDGAPVSAIDNVGAQIGFRAPGTTVELLLWRWNPATGSSRRIAIPVTLGRLDPETMYPWVSQNLKRAGIVALETLTRSKADREGISWEPGVIITDTASGSEFDTDTIITAVDGSAVSSVEDLYARINAALNRPVRPDMIVGIELELLLPSGQEGVARIEMRRRLMTR